MDIGIVLASSGAAADTVARAEELGFSHAWFYDTQLLCGDVFVAMAAAAAATRRIRLGTGVLIPSNRIAPVAANALATLNRMAPGRIDFGVGTGFTGRRTMGVGAMKLADMEVYVETVRGLLAGRTVDFDFEGAPRPVRFLNPELGLIDIESPVPLHVSGFGPKSRALAARLGANWINIVFSERTGLKDMARMHRAWTDAGNAADALYATMFTLGRVLDDGEPCDSPAAMAEAGPAAAVFLHAVVEAEIASGSPLPLPPDQRAAVDAFHEIYRAYEPAEARYLAHHRGHMMFVRPEERPLITGDLIRAKSSTAPRGELVERFRRLKGSGYRQIAVQLMPGREAAIDAWASVLKQV